MKLYGMRILLIALAITYFGTVAVEAHYMNAAGDIRSVLHIDPNDAPIPGRPSGISLRVSGLPEQVTRDRCDCTMTIQKRDDQVETVTLQSVWDHGSVLFRGTYTFPDAGIYTITFAAKPKNGATFKAVSLPNDIRVDGQVLGIASPRTASPLRSSLVAITILLVIAYAISKRLTIT